jgi:hypothetical protein
MINIRLDGPLYFTVSTPCGSGGVGMRHSDDVRIVLDRVMDHVAKCPDCAKKSTETIERDR